MSFNENVEQTLKELGLPLPGKHPETSEPFVSMQLEVRQEMTIYRTLEPRPPSRRVAIDWVYDEDTGEEWEVEWRDLTDEEWQVAYAAYEKARAEWRRTCGEFHSPGPQIFSARFETASGSSVEGVTSKNGSEWIWHASSVKHDATRRAR